MPPKTFTCAVCGTRTSKPKSYALPDGQRACRAHQEALEAHNKREAAAAEDKRRSAEQAERRQQRLRMAAERREWKPGLRCFKCEKEGIPQREFGMRKLVAMEMAKQIHGDKAAALPWDPRSHIEGVSPDKPCLIVVEMPIGKLPRLARDSRLASEITGVALLCPDCIKALDLPDPFKMDTQTLLRLSAIAAAFIQPQIEGAVKSALDAYPEVAAKTT